MKQVFLFDLCVGMFFSALNLEENYIQLFGRNSNQFYFAPGDFLLTFKER